MKKSILLFTLCASLSVQSQSVQTNNSEKGLKDYYKNHFTMGVSVSAQSLKTDEAKLILQHFGSLTAENAMKMGPIHPKENEYF